MSLAKLLGKIEDELKSTTSKFNAACNDFEEQQDIMVRARTV